MLIENHQAAMRMIVGLLTPALWLAATMAAVMLAGLVLGLFLRPLGFLPLDAWYGAAFAAPMGFVAGVVLQTRKHPGSLARIRFVVWVLGGLSVLLPLVALLTVDVWRSAFGV